MLLQARQAGHKGVDQAHEGFTQGVDDAHQQYRQGVDQAARTGAKAVCVSSTARFYGQYAILHTHTQSFPSITGRDAWCSPQGFACLQDCRYTHS